jgi:hypothetical protein
LEPAEPSKGGPPPEEARRLILELGMPPDAKWGRLKMDGAQLANGTEDSERWRDYSLEFFGMVIDPSTTPDKSWPFWRTRDPRGRVDDLVIQLWRQTVVHSTSPLYGEILWHPVRKGSASIKGLERRHTAEDLSDARRGIKLLESFVFQGRRHGTTILTSDEFRERAPIECRKWLDLHTKCVDVDLAYALGISTSTLYSYMRRIGTSMKLIREEAMRLPSI